MDNKVISRRKEALNAVWDEIVQFVEREIFYYEDARLLSPGQVDAENVVDTVAEEVLQNLPDFPPEESRRWILQMALYKLRGALALAWRFVPRNTSLNALASLGKDVTVTDQGEMEFVQPDALNTWADILPDPRALAPEEALLRWEIAEPLASALASLTPKVREMFARYSVDGETAEEIAARQGQTVAEVKQAITQAQEALRRFLGRNTPAVSKRDKAL